MEIYGQNYLVDYDIFCGLLWVHLIVCHDNFFVGEITSKVPGPSDAELAPNLIGHYKDLVGHWVPCNT